MTRVYLAEKRTAGSVIDADRLVESRMLIQGGSGSGKSTLARRILEETSGKIQQIVIDPEGEFATLRKIGDYLICSADGTGDILATVKTAHLLARKIRETGVSAVLDLYDLPPLERKAFVARFLEGLIASPKKYYRPCLVFVDEAHMFAPQSQSAESSIPLQDLAARGRKRKLGLICATHRLSKFHKDVVAELQNRIIGQVGLKNDIASAAEEMGLSVKEARESLVRLNAGQFWTFGPAIGPEFTLIQVAKPKTKAATANTTTAKASASLEKVIETLKELPSEAAKEAQTVKDLQREVAELRQRLRRAEKPPATSAVTAAEVKKYDAAIKRLRGAVEALMKFIVKINAQDFASKVGDVDQDGIRKAIEAAVEHSSKIILAKISAQNQEISSLQKEGQRLIDRIGKLAEVDEVTVSVDVTHNEPFSVKPSAPARSAGNGAFRAKRPTVDGGASRIGKGETKILTAIAQHTDGVDREQLTVLTGYKRSSRDTYLQRLSSAGLVNVGPPITATAEGIAALGTDFEPLPTGTELQEYWLDRLSGGEKAILEVLLQEYPTVVARDEISARTSYKRSSRDTYIQRLRARQLITVAGAGVAASEKLF